MPSPLRESTNERRAEPAATAQRLDGVRFEFEVASSAWLTRDRSAKPMSWNLLIYRAGDGGDTAPLGSLTVVRKVMDSTFPALVWPSDSECELGEDGGFSITWTLEDEDVRDGYTSGGFNHLKQLAALCKRQGWQIADAQEGEEIDLDDPLASFGEDRDE
jgi:hypothetical protein